MTGGDDIFTDDGFLGGRLRILQPRRGFRAGIDSVLLAAAVPARAGDAVFEAGTGPGVAALCLAARVNGVVITGVEEEITSAMLAEKNARRNGLEKALSVIHADICDVLKPGMAGMPRPGSFRHAFANPPYFDAGTVARPENARRAAAHVFAPGDLDDWVKAMTVMVAHRGTVSIIYPASHLERLLAACARRLGSLRVLPLFTRPGRPARRVIVRGVKGARGPLELLPGMLLQDGEGKFTPRAEEILRAGAALDMGDGG